MLRIQYELQPHLQRSFQENDHWVCKYWYDEFEPTFQAANKNAYGFYYLIGH